MIKYPTPHKNKLIAAIKNSKLPKSDIQSLKKAYALYKNWIKSIKEIYSEQKLSSDQKIYLLVKELNQYKNYIDFNLIYESSNDFLYRQTGQMKLGSSIIEEFLPRLIHPSIVGKMDKKHFLVGPNKSLSNLQFNPSVSKICMGGGLRAKEKDQDFALFQKLFLKASHNKDYSDSIEIKTHLSLIVAECKANLDKTMFQEALATANDLKRIVLGSKYFLICEWLDMQPIDTSVTDIDSVLLLRKSKRISEKIRRNFDTVKGRQKHKNDYIKWIHSHPINYEVIKKFIQYIRQVINPKGIDEKTALKRGFF